jgi:hypothetical protein
VGGGLDELLPENMFLVRPAAIYLLREVIEVHLHDLGA